LIYGVNDIADGDTDQFNEKKWQYETLLREQEKVVLSRSIKRINIIDLLIVIVLFVCSVAWQSNMQTGSYRAEWWSIFREYRTAHWWQVFILFVLFFFFAIFYSAYPLRAKARPFLDGIFNVLYIIPWIIGYVMFGWSLWTVNWLMVIWARLRCMAMHAYSAIPDIHADKKAWLETTAVFLWRSNTLHYCGILRTVTAVILYILIWRYAILIALPYIALTILSFERSIMKVYKLFPWINAIVWFVLFWMIVLGN
jgi:4-hydroxybenzoate polyprenyltransferase